MDFWHNTVDELNKVEFEADGLTVDQKLKVIEIQALLAIGQELSRIHHDGINPKYDSGS